MEPRALPLLLVLAAAQAQGGEFDSKMARAREAATRALASDDPRAVRDAYEGFLAAGALRPSDPAPPVEAGLLALAAGDGSFATRMLAAAQKAAPDSGAFRYLRGSLLLARGEYFDALPDFRAAKDAGFRAGKAADRVFDCALGHGFRLVEVHDYEGAVAAFAEAAALKPRHPLVARARLSMALGYRILKSPKDAERVLRECIERFPTYAPAYGELGDLCSDLSRFDEALEVLERASRVDPAYAEAHLLRGSAWTLAGKYAEAEAAFAEFAKRAPPTADSEYRLARFLRRKGEPAKALDALRRSLAMDPTRILPLYEVSLCLRDLGQEAEAEQALEVWKRAEAEIRSHGHGQAPAKEETPPPADGGDRPK